MGNQLTTCCGLCPRENEADDDDSGSFDGCGHCGESDGHGSHNQGLLGDDTSPLIRDGSGIARNGPGGSELGTSYGNQHSSYSKDPLDHFAPSHDPDNTQQQEDDEQQRVLRHLVHGFAGEIVDCSGPDGVVAAVANVSMHSSDRSSNASGGSGTSGGGGGGGVAVLEAPEAAERASDYGKKLSRKATELSKRHFDSDGLKGANKGMEDVSIPHIEAYLNQRAEGVLTDADQVLVTEVASRASDVMTRAGPINVAESEIAVPYGELRKDKSPRSVSDRQ